MLQRIICCEEHDLYCKEQGELLCNGSLTEVGEKAEDDESMMIGIVSLEYMAVHLCAVNILNIVHKKFGTKEEYLAWFTKQVEEAYAKLEVNPRVTANSAGGDARVVKAGNDFH